MTTRTPLSGTLPAPSLPSVAPGSLGPASLGAGGLDVLSKNIGENVRKVHARELATNVVVALFRLVKLSTLHSLDNQAMVRQVEETTQAVSEYCARTDHNVSILFTHGSVFVGGQLLRANRGVYEGALELGGILAKVGAAEIGIRREAQGGDFLAFASALADALRKPKPPRVERPSPNIRLRGLAASALLREDLASERVDPTAQVARTYASAVVIMRRFFEDLRRGKYELPQRVKRVAQRLVDLSMGETPAFLGVTAARNQNHDEAGRAVNTAILALAMTRQVTTDVVQLARIAMAALLYDCARARISGVVGMPSGGIMPQLSEQQENEAAAGTAVVLTALGRINEPSVMRTVISYEAHWERRRERLGPVYRGLRTPSLQARIVHIARAFNDLLTPAPGQNAPTADETIAKLEQETSEAADRTVIRLLIGALGIFTTGTIVRLDTGETGIVVQTPSHPSLYSQPRVRLVLDARGGWLQPAVELDLAHQRSRNDTRHIKEVVATSDDPAGAQMRQYAAASAPAATMNPPSGQTGSTSGPTSGAQSYPGSPSSSQSYPGNPPSAQVNPPSYQNPASYQITPPSFQVRTSASGLRPPRASQPPPPPRQRTITRSGDVGPDSPAPHGARSPAAHAAYPESPYAEDPHAAFAPGTPAYDPAYADVLRQPIKPGRTTTLQTPVFGQEPPLPQAPREAVYELPDDEEIAELIPDDEGGGSTRAVSVEERARLLAAFPVSERRGAEHATQVPASAAPRAPIVVAPEPEPDPEPPPRPTLEPTAEGVLQKTPVVNLLIYMLDQRLTGTTVFTLSNGVEHSVYFHDGTPAKVKTGTMLQPLDRVLLDEGLLDETTLRGTLLEVSKKNVLHGRLLVMKGLLEGAKVVHALRVQVLRKVVGLFDLPGDTRYAYYADRNLIAAYGGPELTPTEPLAVIMAGIRLMGGEPIVEATLARIAGRPLALHIDADTKRMQLTRDEQSVVDLMRARPTTLDALLEGGVAQEQVVRQVVYGLVVTRHIDLGAARTPVGFGRPLVAEGAIRQPEEPAGAPEPAPRAAAPAPQAPAPPRAQPTIPAAKLAPAPPPAPPAPAAAATPIAPAPQAASPPLPAARAMPPRIPTGRPRSGNVDSVGPPSSQSTPAPTSPAVASVRPPQAPIEVAFATRDEAPPISPRAAPTTQLKTEAPPARAVPPRRPPPPPPPRPTQAPLDQPAPSDPFPMAHAIPLGPPPSMPPSMPPSGPVSGPVAMGPIAPPPMAAPIAASIAAPVAAPIAPAAPIAAPQPAGPPGKPTAAARRSEIEKRAQTIDGESYFEMLGVAEDATQDQIKAAYFGLAKSWHPDRLPLDLLDVKPLVARVFARFSEAYQTLSDPAKAKGYAEILRSGASSNEDQERVARVVDAALEFQKAEILLKKNDLVGSEQLAAHAVEADPDQPEYAALLVWIRALRRGDPPDLREGQSSTHFDDLIKVLDGILAKEQRFERALYYRGVLLKRSGRVEKAIRDFRLASEINPKNLDAVREVRLYEMRKRGAGNAPPAKDKPAEGQEGGLFGKFFKR